MFPEILPWGGSLVFLLHPEKDQIKNNGKELGGHWVRKAEHPAASKHPSLPQLHDWSVATQTSVCACHPPPTRSPITEAVMLVNVTLQKASVWQLEEQAQKKLRIEERRESKMLKTRSPVVAASCVIQCKREERLHLQPLQTSCVCNYHNMWQFQQIRSLGMAMVSLPASHSHSRLLANSYYRMRRSRTIGHPTRRLPVT